MNESAQVVIDWLDQNQSPFVEMANQIWESPELAWEEFKSSRLQAELLENEGFSITWDVGGLNTAFVAAWGEVTCDLFTIRRWLMCVIPIRSVVKRPSRNQAPLTQFPIYGVFSTTNRSMP